MADALAPTTTAFRLIEALDRVAEPARQRIEDATSLSSGELGTLWDAAAILPDPARQLVEQMLEDWPILERAERTAGLLTVAELLAAHLRGAT